LRVLTRKLLRDVRRSKARSFAIIGIVTVTALMFSAMWNGVENIDRSFQNSYHDLNYNDLIFDTGFANQSVEKSLHDVYNVKDIESRLFLAGQVQTPSGESLAVQWISVNDSRHPVVNDLYVVEGDYFSGTGSSEALVVNSFADEKNIKVGQNITLQFGSVVHSFVVSGMVMSPEYFWIGTYEAYSLPIPGRLGVVFTPLSLTQSLLEASLIASGNDVNQFCVTVSVKSELDRTQQEFTDALLASGVVVKQSFKGTQEFSYTLYNEDVNSFSEIIYIFAGVILIMAVIAVYNTVTRVIMSEHNIIGVMDAIGARRRRIMNHYLGFSVFLGTIGTLIGLALGYMTSIYITDAYASTFGIQPLFISHAVNWWAFVKTVIICVSVISATGLLASFAATKMRTREAMSSAYQTVVFNRRSRIEKLFRKSSNLNKFVFRSIFKKKKRTAVTVFAIGISLVLVIATIAVINSMEKTVEKTFTDYEKWDFRADFVSPLERSQFDGDISTIEGVKIYEGFVQAPVLLTYGGEQNYYYLSAYENNSELRNYHVIDGEERLTETSVMVGKMTADDNGISVGDQITLTGNLTKLGITVSGITGEGIDTYFFSSMEFVQELLGLGGNFTAILVKTDSGEKREQVKEALGELPYVAKIYDSDDLKSGMRRLMEEFWPLMYVLVGMGVLAGGLFTFNTILLNSFDKRLQFASLRAIGASPTRIYRAVILESLTLTFLGLILAIPAGYLASVEVVVWMQRFMWVELTMPVMAFVIAFIIAIVTALTAAILSARQVNSINLVDITREYST